MFQYFSFNVHLDFKGVCSKSKSLDALGKSRRNFQHEEKDELSFALTLFIYLSFLEVIKHYIYGAKYNTVLLFSLCLLKGSGVRKERFIGSTFWL